MKFNFLKQCVLTACLAVAANQAFARSVTFDFNYMATNLKGDFATASGGTATSVGSLNLKDINTGNGGVRATLSLNANGLSQFSSGKGNVFLSSFELNFPNMTEANGYDSDANGGLGNQWSDVSGTALAGGVEWQEGGATNGWSGFGQELNFADNAMTGGNTVVDLFNSATSGNISVTSILTNAVFNADTTKPSAYAWLKIRSLDKGILANGWWGNTAATKKGKQSLDVLATGYTEDISEVPVPAALPLMASALGLFGLSRKRKQT